MHRDDKSAEQVNPDVEESWVLLSKLSQNNVQLSGESSSTGHRSVALPVGSRLSVFLNVVPSAKVDAQ